MPILFKTNGLALTYSQFDFGTMMFVVCCERCMTNLTRGIDLVWRCQTCFETFGEVTATNSHFLMTSSPSVLRMNGINIWASTWLRREVEIQVDWEG